jgi:hypothetical protein
MDTLTRTATRIITMTTSILTAKVALLLILGLSPMVEGPPAFFGAGKFGVGQLIVMSLVFAASTIITYVVLCVASVAGLGIAKLGPLTAPSR